MDWNDNARVLLNEEGITVQLSASDAKYYWQLAIRKDLLRIFKFAAMPFPRTRKVRLLIITIGLFWIAMTIAVSQDSHSEPPETIFFWFSLLLIPYFYFVPKLLPMVRNGGRYTYITFKTSSTIFPTSREISRTLKDMYSAREELETLLGCHKRGTHQHEQIVRAISSVEDMLFAYHDLVRKLEPFLALERNGKGIAHELESTITWDREVELSNQLASLCFDYSLKTASVPDTSPHIGIMARDIDEILIKIETHDELLALETPETPPKDRLLPAALRDEPAPRLGDSYTNIHSELGMCVGECAVCYPHLTFTQSHPSVIKQELRGRVYTDGTGF